MNDVTGMELPATPELRFTVDGHLTPGDQGLCLGAAGGGTGQLEQLTEADHVTCDLDVSLHRYPSILPGGPPRDAISDENALPAVVGMLSESAVALHSPSCAAYVSVPVPAPHPISMPLE